MNLILFLLVVVIAFAVVRIGAVAFALTGVEWTVAKFQALSCFTSTGFTTKESELIVQSQQRRKIATILMIFGHAGLVTLVATFVNSLRPSKLVHNAFEPIFQLDNHPIISIILNVLIIAFFCWIIISAFSRTKFSKKITKIIQNYFIKKQFIKKVYVQDLVISGDGFGIINIEVTKQSDLYHASVSDIQKHIPDMKILAIERGKNIVTNITDDTRLLLGDDIISYGKIDKIKKILQQDYLELVKKKKTVHKKPDSTSQ